jgi:hypothetical protein
VVKSGWVVAAGEKRESNEYGDGQGNLKNLLALPLGYLYARPCVGAFSAGLLGNVFL